MTPREDPDETISPDEGRLSREPGEGVTAEEGLEGRIDSLRKHVKARFDLLAKDIADTRRAIQEGRNETAEVKGISLRAIGMLERLTIRIERSVDQNEITDADLAKLRKEFRDSQTSMRAPPDDWHDMTATAKGRALDAKDAELMMANKELAEFRTGAAERAESRRYWGRQIVNWIALVMIGLVTGYGVYRATKPATSVTIESKAAK